MVAVYAKAIDISDEDIERIKEKETELINTISEIAYKYSDTAIDFIILVYALVMRSTAHILQNAVEAMNRTIKEVGEEYGEGA